MYKSMHHIRHVTAINAKVRIYKLHLELLNTAPIS